MVEQLKTVEIDTEKGICRVNGKDVEDCVSYFKIEFKEGNWTVEQKWFETSQSNSNELHLKIKQLTEKQLELLYHESQKNAYVSLSELAELSSQMLAIAKSLKDLDSQSLGGN